MELIQRAGLPEQGKKVSFQTLFAHRDYY